MTAMAADFRDTSMTASDVASSTPSAQSVAPAGAVMRAVGFAWVMTALLLAGVLLLLGRADWWRGGAAATIATAMASIASLPIIILAMRFGKTRPDLAAGAFFAAAAVRAGITLGAAMLAVRLGGYPKTPTLLMVVPYYFALLAAETFVLARSLWTSGRTAQAKTEEKHA
jgi:hypothetical protein